MCSFIILNNKQMNSYDIAKYFDKLPCYNSNGTCTYDALLLLVNNNYKVVSYNYTQKIDIKKCVILEDEFNNKYIEIPLYYICDVISGCYTDSPVIIELVINNKKMILNKNTKIFIVASRNTQHYVRLTFKEKLINEIIFYYIGYVCEMEIRKSFIPPPNNIYYSGRLKYDYIESNLASVCII